MSFNEFMDKYLGMIIGIVVAVLLIVLNLLYVAECIVVIVAFAWLGKYIQGNKEKVKEKLKGMIDKF